MAINWPWRREGTEQKANITDILKELAQGWRSKSGASVTLQTAIETSVSFACARKIADGLAQVPFKLFRELPGGGKNVASDHPLYEILSLRPNELQTAYELFEQIGLHLVFCGNFYAFKNIVRGVVVELLPFEPGTLTVTRGKDRSIGYKVRLSDGSSMEIPAANMWHIRGPSWNGWMGLEGVRFAREAIGLALSTEEHSSRMFSNGASVGGVLSTESTLKQEQVDLLRKSWDETQGGTANAFKTAILWGGLKWMPRAMQNDQAQLIEQRRFQVEEVCRAFGVLPIMVGSADKTATYASSEQMFLAHVVHTMGPWYRRIEQSVESNLIGAEDRKAGVYARFIPAGLLRGAHKDRSEYFAKALGSGGSPAWMTQDEVRGLDDLNPMGGDAAVLPKPSNVGGLVRQDRNVIDGA